MISSRSIRAKNYCTDTRLPAAQSAEKRENTIQPTVVEVIPVPGLLVVPVLGAPERAERQDLGNVNQIHGGGLF